MKREKEWPEVYDLSDWVAEVLARPPPRWLIKGWIPQGAVTYVSGPPKLGSKTFTATLLAILMASQRSLGPWEPVEPARVLAVYKEGIESGTANMIAGICKMLGVPVPSAPAFSITHHAPLHLDQAADVRWLFEQFERTGCNVVLLDTLYTMISGDENKQEDANKVVETLFKIREAGVASLVLCHTRKDAPKTTDPDTRVRGSSVLVGAYDSHISLWRDKKQSWQNIQFRSRYASESEWRQWWKIESDPETGRILKVSYDIKKEVSNVSEYSEKLRRKKK